MAGEIPQLHLFHSSIYPWEHIATQDRFYAAGTKTGALLHAGSQMWESNQSDHDFFVYELAVDMDATSSAPLPYDGSVEDRQFFMALPFDLVVYNSRLELCGWNFVVSTPVVSLVRTRTVRMLYLGDADYPDPWAISDFVFSVDGGAYTSYAAMDNRIVA